MVILFTTCKGSHSRLLQKGPEHQVPLAIFYGGNVSNISPKKDKGIYQGRMLYTRNWGGRCTPSLL